MISVVIRVNGSEITDDVIFADATFTASVGAYPGEFAIRVKDPTIAYAFKPTDNITLDIDGVRSFDGYIMQVSQGFAFPVVDSARPQVLIWSLKGPDINYLFVKRFVYKVSAPQERIPDFPVGTTDEEALDTLVADYLDVGDLGVTTDFEQVGIITPDEAGLPFDLGDTWQTAMYNISHLPGAVWGIKPDRTFYYADDDTEDAPFRLSDTPDNSSSFGYSNMDWTYDGTTLVNDSFFWGAGIGSDQMVYSRVQDAISIAAHGLWQSGQLRSDIWRQTSADLISTSVVYGTPQNLHGAKDDAELVTLRIKKPGLTPGDKVHLTSDIFGISKVFPIRRMTMTFPTKTAALYDLQLSYDIDRPLSFYNWRPFPRVPPPPPRDACVEDEANLLSRYVSPGSTTFTYDHGSVPAIGSIFPPPPILSRPGGGIAYSGILDSALDDFVNAVTSVPVGDGLLSATLFGGGIGGGSSSGEIVQLSHEFDAPAPYLIVNFQLTVEEPGVYIGPSAYLAVIANMGSGDLYPSWQFGLEKAASSSAVKVYIPRSSTALILGSMAVVGLQIGEVPSGTDLTTYGTSTFSPDDEGWTTTIQGYWGSYTWSKRANSFNDDGTAHTFFTALGMRYRDQNSLVNGPHTSAYSSFRITDARWIGASDCAGIGGVLQVTSTDPRLLFCESPQRSGNAFTTSYQYMPGSIDVFLNGTMQRPGYDYNETGFTGFAFTSGLPDDASVFCCYRTRNT